MTHQERIRELVNKELDRKYPMTQQECCAMAARVSCAVSPCAVPQNDDEFLSAALASARGLFGPAFRKASYAQKSTWIDMCERALRAEVKSIQRKQKRAHARRNAKRAA